MFPMIIIIHDQLIYRFQKITSHQRQDKTTNKIQGNYQLTESKTTRRAGGMMKAPGGGYVRVQPISSAPG
ncbi:MAG: hypothetical protein ABW087_05750, partial [Candidatus Thiodiazotropha sp.]